MKSSPLNELGFVGRGKSRHRPRNDPQLYGGNHPFIQTADVKNASLYVSEYSQTYNDFGLEQSKLWRKGTLCITIAANIADSAILGIDACFPDSVIGFIPYEDKADVRFVKYYFDLFQIVFKQIAQGAAQDNLSLEKLLSLKIPCPPIKTQKKIAAILSAYDDLIENNLKRIKLLEEMAQITYEEWFVRLKFPGHENTKMDSETGLPESWVKDRVDKVFVLQRGFDLPVQDREKGDIPIIASTGIIDWHSESKVIGAGVITGRSGTIGEVIYCPNDFWPLNTALWVKEYKKGGPLFAYYFLKNFDLNRFGGGSAVPSLDRKVVHAQRVAIPSVDLLALFEEQIQPVFTAINNLQKQNKLLQEARDILLPRLMTGMIDVDKITIPTELIERVT